MYLAEKADRNLHCSKRRLSSTQSQSNSQSSITSIYSSHSQRVDAMTTFTEKLGDHLSRFQAITVLLLLLISDSAGFVVSSSPSPKLPSCRMISTRGGYRSSSKAPEHKLSYLKAAETSDEQDSTQESIKGGRIVISSEINLPVSSEVAFDAYSDLPRQASWSPWLRSVEYVGDEQNETLWKMRRIMGVSYSWTAINRRVERPSVIEWESTKGLKNFGRVDFTSTSPNSTLMRVSLTFKVPRLVSRMLGKRNSIEQLVEKKMVAKSLQKFRDIVVEEEGMSMASATQNKEALEAAQL